MRIPLDQGTTIWRRTAQTLVILLLTLGLSSAAPAQTRIRLATIVPTGTSYHHSLQAMGAKWKQASGGTVGLTIYADGTMGSEPETVRRMRIGQLQAAVLTVAGLSEIDPAVSALQKMPLMFRSLDEAAYVRAKLAPELDRRLAEKGFVVLFWTDAGWVRFFSKEPAIVPDDFKRMKFVVSAGDTDQYEVIKELGFNPVLVEWSDSLTGLQTGMINSLSTVPLHALTSQFYQVTHHMLEVRGGLDRDKVELGCASARPAGSHASRRGRVRSGVPESRPPGKSRSSGSYEEAWSSGARGWPGFGKSVASVRGGSLPEGPWPRRARRNV